MTNKSLKKISNGDIMKDGCIHNIFDNTCNKYGFLCNGNTQNKAKCPEWGAVMAAETYYSEKLKRENPENEIDEENLQDIYSKGKTSLAYQVNANTIDWKYQKSYFGFKKESDVRKYIMNKLREDGLIECQNCRRWDKDSSICRYRKQVSSETESCREFASKEARGFL